MNPTPHSPSKAAEPPIERRTAALRSLARRFRRRWISGIIIGVGLVALNTGVDVTRLRATRAEVGGIDEAVAAVDRLALESAAISVLSLAVIAALAFKFFLPMDRTLAMEHGWFEDAERAQLADDARRTFESEVVEALDFGSDDLRLSLIADHVLETIAPGSPSELLMADASDAHMTTWASNRSRPEPGCNVPSPFECPAVKRSRPYTVTSSEAINACPHLRNRPTGPCAAHCVPVAFMGRAVGVLHLTAKEGTTFDDEVLERASTFSEQIGARIGTVRAFAKAQLQASTDSLTGLDNRRSIENALSDLLAQGRHFTIAMADLDEFKKLNDTYGHDVGDRALRSFARCVRSTLREGDLFARWGGEEFVIALPDVDPRDGVKVLHRAQAALAELCWHGTVPSFTVSFGVSHSASSPHLDQLLEVADEALLRAKRSGRDRICLAGVPEPFVRSAPAATRRADDVVPPVLKSATA